MSQKSVHQKPVIKASVVKKERFLSKPIQIFLAGCIAELYLLAVKRYYVNGYVEQMLAWDDAMRYLLFGGLALLAVGLVIGLVFRKKPCLMRGLGWWLAVAGAYLAGGNWVMRSVYPTGVTIMSVVTLASMLLGILWFLYERECLYALTILGLTIFVLWICRRGLSGDYWRARVLTGAVIYLAAMAVTALLVRRADLRGGMLGKLRVLPADADTLPIYVACGSSAAAVVLAIFSTAAAYYAMWVIGVMIFLLAVYYTVKQL
jgi:hypothetical protein